jgi:hypothetical protein
MSEVQVPEVKSPVIAPPLPVVVQKADVNTPLEPHPLPPGVPAANYGGPQKSDAFQLPPLPQPVVQKANMNAPLGKDPVPIDHPMSEQMTDAKWGMLTEEQRRARMAEPRGQADVSQVPMPTRPGARPDMPQVGPQKSDINTPLNQTTLPTDHPMYSDAVHHPEPPAGSPVDADPFHRMSSGSHPQDDVARNMASRPGDAVRGANEINPDTGMTDAEWDALSDRQKEMSKRTKDEAACKEDAAMAHMPLMQWMSMNEKQRMAIRQHFPAPGYTAWEQNGMSKDEWDMLPEAKRASMAKPITVSQLDAMDDANAKAVRNDKVEPVLSHDAFQFTKGTFAELMAHIKAWVEWHHNN